MEKSIFVTGGSRGIGRATAVLAARKGWSVGFSYADNRAAAEATIAAAGGQTFAVQGDVALEAEVMAMFEQADQVLGAIDGVVVNAGIVAPSLRLVDMSGERMRRVFEVNVLGAYLCAREAARRMAKSRGGRGGSIVIVSSAAARIGAPFEFVDYAGSKGALDTLTIGLSKELGAEGVRVNAVRPGLIETDIHGSAGDPERAQRLGVTTPMARAGRPEEVAEAILWLLDDPASYVTGSILDVAGGR